jgi:hypothetical protein
MENEAFKRTLTLLADLGFDVLSITTDKHSAITKLMKSPPYKDNVEHYLDPWHVVKNFRKKLLVVS